MKKGAIFDMDGTLFDTERLYHESWDIVAVELQSPVSLEVLCGNEAGIVVQGELVDLLDAKLVKIPSRVFLHGNGVAGSLRKSYYQHHRRTLNR